MDFKSWSDVQKYMLEGGRVTTGVWYFSQHSWACFEGCCDGPHEDIEDALSSVMYFSNDDLAEVSKYG